MRLFNTKLRLRMGLFTILFVALTIVTTITSYANDEVSSEENVAEIVVDNGPIINDETASEEGNDETTSEGDSSLESDDEMAGEDEKIEKTSDKQEEISEVGEDKQDSSIEADSTHNSQTNSGDDTLFTTSGSGVKPKMDFTYLGATPSNPMQGQEFTVRYKLTPHPFQHNISKPKEIVLVLDGSGSMSNNNKINNLKKAAKEFISQLKGVENLKIGIVVYSSEATINPISVSSRDKNSRSLDSSSSHRIPNYTSLTDEFLLDVTDERLNQMIDNIKALGGTNTGEGLRKAEFLLGKGDSTANKTVILMSDGLPTFYSVGGSNNNSHYTKIDDTDPNYRGNGSDSNSTTVNKSTDYAKAIGNLIRNNNYNIFSIGYGLGSSTSTANKKLQEIHTSMGGVASGDSSTFFASDEGAIDAVFNKIADQLQKSYAFTDAQLNLNLAPNITLSEETSIKNKIKINPIVYELGENDWYHAPEQIIEFKIKVDSVGDIKIFNDPTTVTYTDLFGNLQTMTIPSPTIPIKPFDLEVSKKLQIDFQSLSNGYLIGDTAVAKVTVLNPVVSGITFNQTNFNLETLPNNLKLKEGNNTLNFGTIKQATSQNYQLIIGNDSEITVEKAKAYDLAGNYSYQIKQGSSTKNESGNDSTRISVKRGQIKVKVVDELDSNVSDLVKVSLKGTNYTGEYQNGYIIFDTIPSGNYELVLESLPDGLTISLEQSNAKVMLNYDNNVAEYQFKVDGTYEDGLLPNIKANLLSVNPSIVSNGQEIDVTYQITPQEFDALFNGGNEEFQQIKEAMFVVDASGHMTQNGWNNAVKNGLTNQITQHSEIIEREFKMGIVGYNDKVIFPNNDSSKVGLYNLANNDDRNNFRRIVQEDQLRYDWNNMSTKIDDALIKADDILSSSGTNYGKAIVIISAGNIEISQSTIEKIQSKGYKIISFYVGNNPAVTQGSYHLRDLHTALGGKEDYFETPYEGGNYNFANRDMENVRKSLLTDISSSPNLDYEVTPTLSFDLGNHFLPVSGLTWMKDTSYQLELPTINYKSTTQNSDGTYKYEAEEFEVSFKIKLNTEQLGEVTFANTEDKIYNNITYTQFDGKELMKLIETPKVEVIEMPIEISHGLYGGINADKTSVDIIPSVITTDGQDLRKTFVAPSTINFAGLVSYHPNLREITLYTDQRLNINPDKIEVYKVITSQNGRIKLEKLLDVKMTSSEIDSYKKVLFNLPEGLADTSSLLIRYSTLAPDIDEGTFKNAIVAGTESEVVEVKTISEKNPDQSNLPNLF